MRPSPHQRGFTLIEVMIALVITSMILTTLYAALGAVAKSWNSGAEQGATAAGRRAGFQFLRRELAQLAPLRLRDLGGERVVFMGAPETLTFAAPIPSHRASGGLFLVSFTLERGEEGGFLRLRYKRLPAAPDDDLEAKGDDWDEHILIEDIERLRFEYYGAGAAGDGKSWYESWPFDKSYPEAVRVRLGFAAGGVAWPDIIVPIRARVERNTRRFALLLRGAEPRSFGRSASEPPAPAADPDSSGQSRVGREPST